LKPGHNDNRCSHSTRLTDDAEMRIRADDRAQLSSAFLVSIDEDG
jgi:hypothetical protein